MLLGLTQRTLFSGTSSMRSNWVFSRISWAAVGIDRPMKARIPAGFGLGFEYVIVLLCGGLGGRG